MLKFRKKIKIAPTLKRPSENIAKPSQMGPQQGFFCPVLVEPIEWNWVCRRSKEKFLTLLTAERGRSARSSRCGCFTEEIFLQGCSRESSRGGVPGIHSDRSAVAASLRMAGCRHLGLSCCSQGLCCLPELRQAQPFFRRNSGLKCLFEATAWNTLWASETRLITKDKKVRLYFVAQILFLFPLFYLMGFAGDKKLSCFCIVPSVLLLFLYSFNYTASAFCYVYYSIVKFLYFLYSLFCLLK